jgi:hypothetical protein
MASFADRVDAQKESRSMLIKLPKDTYRLGEPIPLSVSIANGSRDKLVREDPKKSLDVVLHVVDRKTREDLSYAMGRTTQTVIDKASGQFAVVLPNKTPVTIEPGAALTFETDLNQRLFLRPGRYDCTVREQDVTSNQLELQIEVTRQSIDELFALARNPTGDFSRREWAMDLLRRVYPPLRLHLTPNDAVPGMRAENEARNRPLYNAFLMWWKEHRELKETAQKLRALSSAP